MIQHAVAGGVDEPRDDPDGDRRQDQRDGGHDEEERANAGASHEPVHEEGEPQAEQDLGRHHEGGIRRRRPEGLVKQRILKGARVIAQADELGADLVVDRLQEREHERIRDDHEDRPEHGREHRVGEPLLLGKATGPRS